MRPFKIMGLILVGSFLYHSITQASLEPSLGASLSVTSDAQRTGSGANFYYDISSALGISLAEKWKATPSYAFGLNTLDGETETFSTTGVSVKYNLAEYWRVTPGVSATFAHDSGYNSQKFKISLTYLFPEPSRLSVYAGPSFFRDSDQNRKLGASAGVAGSFTDPWFWYLDGAVSGKVRSGAINTVDFTLTAGTGYDILDSLSLFFDISIFRGSSGLSINTAGDTLGTKGISAVVAAKGKSTESESETVQKSSGVNSTEVTFTIGTDYYF